MVYVTLMTGLIIGGILATTRPLANDLNRLRAEQQEQGARCDALEKRSQPILDNWYRREAEDAKDSAYWKSPAGKATLDDMHKQDDEARAHFKALIRKCLDAHLIPVQGIPADEDVEPYSQNTVVCVQGREVGR